MRGLKNYICKWCNIFAKKYEEQTQALIPMIKDICDSGMPCEKTFIEWLQS